MTYSELIREIGTKTGCGERWAKLMVDAFREIVIREVLDKDEFVSIPTFGVFSPRIWVNKPRGARTFLKNASDDPTTWKQLIFKCSSKIRRRMN